MCVQPHQSGHTHRSLFLASRIACYWKKSRNQLLERLGVRVYIIPAFMVRISTSVVKDESDVIQAVRMTSSSPLLSTDCTAFIQGQR